MTIPFKNIDPIFARAENDGRSFLFEHEVYQMLKEAGIRTPRFVFVKRGQAVRAKRLAGFKSAGLVLKIVAPLIQHKTDVGGVLFVKNAAAAVNAGIKSMLAEVPRRFLEWSGAHGRHAAAAVPSLEEIGRDVRGVLVCEMVDYEKVGFGTELLIGVRNSREFGPIVTMGAGGVEVEYLNARIKEGKATSIASAHLLQKKDVSAHLEPLAVYDKLVKPFRSRPAVLDAAELRDVYSGFCGLAAHYSPFRPGGRYVIEEAEVNPFVVRAGKLLPLDGLCRFSRRHIGITGRPFAEIRRLLRPASIAVIGVSEKMNLGHIILNNVLKNGFPPERVYFVKPGPRQIEGCLCVPDVASLPETVDLFVLTLTADLCYGVMADLIAHGKARSVIIIAGGMGEKEGTHSLEERITGLIAEGRAQGSLTPVVNGGNCLGIYSKPGRYDTTFIPEHKLKFPKTATSNLAYISQSGAFLISRVSKLQRYEPLYGVSLGNQIDLRLSDYLNYLKDEDDVKIFAVYAEGFKPGDGYLLAEAARDIAGKEGRAVVFYKSGRTPEGRLATSSHTASVAGEYDVCKAVLEEAGVFVADGIFEFENMIKGLGDLAGKTARGNRVGLLSNAGFESVIMSDSIRNGESLVLAALSDATKKRLAGALAPLGIDKLQDIKNPLDVTPVANDAVFCECARALLEDPGVDCAVISPVPMTPAMQTLAPGEGYPETIHSPDSTSSRLIAIFRATDKPFVVNVDAGAPYDPMVAQMEEAGIPVFRRSDDAVKFLRKYVNFRLKSSKAGGRR
jgi:acyl-CoA synthetase (NDP forming)